MHNILYRLFIVIGLTCVEACEEGWIERGGNCYYFTNLFRDYEGAYNYCRNMDAHLASIHSDDENKFVHSNAKEIGAYQVYLGLYSPWEYGPYHWNDGSIFAFTNFQLRQPDYSGRCISLNFNKGYWFSRPCNTRMNLVCKRHSDTFYGCIESPSSELRKVSAFKSNRMSIPLCYQRCQVESKLYAALIQRECFCFDTFPSHTNLSWTSCDKPCPEHLYQSCGGVSEDHKHKIAFVIGGGTTGMLASSCIDLELMGLTNDTFVISKDNNNEIVHCGTQGNVTCPTGWINVKGKCYKFETAKIRYHAPASECILRGGYLTSVHNIDDINALRDVISNGTSLKGKDTWLVGLFDSNKREYYRWADGHYVNLSSLTVTITNLDRQCYVFEESSTSAELLSVGCTKNSYICSMGEDFVGCHQAPTSTPIISQCHENNVQQCVERCRQLGTTYAMMQYIACWCENNLTESVNISYCKWSFYSEFGQSCAKNTEAAVATYTVAAFPSYATSCQELFDQGVLIPGLYVINGNSVWCSFPDNSTVCPSSDRGLWLGVGQGGICYVMDARKYRFNNIADSCHDNGVPASIHSYEEFDNLIKILWNFRSLIQKTTITIGGFDEFDVGLFSWADGSLMRYAPWATNKPTIGEGKLIVFRLFIKTPQFVNKKASLLLRVCVCRQVTDYYGCYRISTGMIPIVSNYSSMFLTLCKQLCMANGTDIALVHTNNCYCTQRWDIDSMTPISDNACNTPCPANHLQSCGGEDTVRAYSLDLNISHLADNCSQLYNNGILYEASYYLRTSHDEKTLTTCGFHRNSTCKPGWLGYDGNCFLPVLHKRNLQSADECRGYEGVVMFAMNSKTSLYFIRNLITEVPVWSQFKYWHLGASSPIGSSFVQTSEGRILDLGPKVTSDQEQHCTYMDMERGEIGWHPCNNHTDLPYICMESEVYVGCVNHSITPKFSVYLFTPMTVGQCRHYCKGGSTTFAGISLASCQCFDDVTWPSYDGPCNAVCSGSIVQLCGSNDGMYMSVYKTESSDMYNAASCSDLFNAGITIPDTYVIYPDGEPVQVRCFSTGPQYGEILGEQYGQLIASTEAGQYEAVDARIAFQYFPSFGWMPKLSDQEPWIQAEFEEDYIITAVMVKGGQNMGWATPFDLVFSSDGVSWTTYPKHLPGATDPNTPVMTYLLEPFPARYVQMKPEKGSQRICMRFELYGQKYEDFDYEYPYVGCFRYFDISEFECVELSSIDECKRSCHVVSSFYAIVRGTKSLCCCAHIDWRFGRLDDALCGSESHIGSSPCGSEEVHSVAVFRAYGDKHCGFVQMVGNASFPVIYGQNSSTAFAQYTCLTGYEFPGTGDTERNVTCLQNRTLSETVEACQIIQCPDPAPFFHGILSYSKLDYGSIVTYECEPGFELYPGVVTATIICLSSKQWNKTFETCEPCVCPLPPLILRSVSVQTNSDHAVYTDISVHDVSANHSFTERSSASDYNRSVELIDCIMKEDTTHKGASVLLGEIDQRLVGEVELTTARSKFDCAIICLSHVSCYSYNFKVSSDSGNCELVVQSSSISEYATDVQWSSYQLREKWIKI